MKKTLTIAFLLLIGFSSNAQLPIVHVNENVSTHFTSRNKIDYSDISTSAVTGDLPMENILRIKPIKNKEDLGYLTIVGEDFFLQFKLEYTGDPLKADKHINLENPPKPNMTSVDKTPQTGGYDNPNYTLTSTKLKQYATLMLDERPTIYTVTAKAHKFIVRLNNIWVRDNYIFFDYTAKNKTDIPYSIDEIRYKVVDQKLVKAESNQDQSLLPTYTHNETKEFTQEFRNIVAIKKFTFPEDKSFIIHIAEDQLSGRNVTLHIDYKDLLQAKVYKAI